MSIAVPVLPVTKFRVPRLREGTVRRAALVARLEESTRLNPVTLLCAPGGSGKTTLLAQLAERVREAYGALVWVAIDEEDDDPNRLFATLVQALEPLDLAWEMPPRELAARVIDAGAQSRAALAAAVNALCTSAASRIVVVLDDLHRVGRPDVVTLVESLVERLPDHVTLAIGTRVEPALPLARWRAHGEVGEFGLRDLRFSEDEALTLAGPAPDGKSVRDALRRTQGWAVGLSLLLHAGTVAPARHGSSPALAASGEAGQRKLFAYLAHEVLDHLPGDLRDFALRCSILAELTPALCAAVTGRDDAAELLAELDRRDLFLVLVDDAGPVLRFHDLFREFLELELARRLPDELRALHERAARAEQTSARAIHHYLAGECWDEALWLILRIGETLVAAGAVATLERWIDQVPEQVRRDNPHVSYLRGSCAWLRWDWSRARRELAPATAGLTANLEMQSRMRAYFMLIDALTSSGELDDARRRLDEVAQLPLDSLGQAEFALLQGWCHVAEGRLVDAEREMNRFATLAERSPEIVCPVTAGRIHCLMIGLPGVAGVFTRFTRAARTLGATQHAPWHLAALAVEGWVELWRGDAAGAQVTIDRAEALYHQFGGIRLIGERLGQLRAMHAAARGRHEDALALARRHVDGMHAPELAPHRAVWLRAYWHGFARLLWMAGDLQEFLTLVPALTAPRVPPEWGFVEVGADVVRGQAALARGTPDAAIEPLERAIAHYAEHCLPSVFCDPRVSLAYAWTLLRERRRAWECIEPLHRAAVEADEYGPLLLDARRHVFAVLDALPEAIRESAGTLRVRERLEAWSPAAGTDVAHTRGPLARLSDREREVLAAVAGGAGNKHIARALDLSLHTVKRHVANILDKLDCASRGQAAELYRRTAT